MNIKKFFKELFLSKEEIEVMNANKETLAQAAKFNEYAKSVPSNDMGGEFLFDFVGDMYGGRLIAAEQPNAFDNTEINGTDGSSESMPKKVQKIKAMPIDVFDQLEKIPSPISLLGLDEKIEMTKQRAGMIKQYYAKREVEAMIERLEMRKKYEGDVKTYFSQFDSTSDANIHALLDKYTLEMHPSDLFIPEFPDEAIKTMKEYSDQVEALCGKKPVFYVISEAGDFRKKYERRDPILLAQSPFGFFYNILGVWGLEHMQLLSEL